jgi:hypothetical protein
MQKCLVFQTKLPSSRSKHKNGWLSAEHRNPRSWKANYLIMSSYFKQRVLQKQASNVIPDSSSQERSPEIMPPGKPNCLRCFGRGFVNEPCRFWQSRVCSNPRPHCTPSGHTVACQNLFIHSGRMSRSCYCPNCDGSGMIHEWVSTTYQRDCDCINS